MKYYLRRSNLRSYVLAACALMFSSLAVSGPQTPAPEAESPWLGAWERLDSDGDIEGLQRQHKSKIYQYKMTTVVDASTEALAALLLDGNQVASWAPGTLSSVETARADDSSSNIVYATYQFPGAVNRDSLIASHARYDETSREIKITFKTLSEKGPKTDLRLVRFPLVAGSWTLQPLPNGQTKVTHLNLALPGGIVQDNLYYVYNIGARQSAFDTLKALKKAVVRDKYRDVRLGFIHAKRQTGAYLSER